MNLFTRRGEQHPKAAFTQKEAAAIRRRVATEGISHRALAKELGVDSSTIDRLCAGWTYEDDDR